MGILKTRKNKKFNYTPRYYKHSSNGSPFEMKHKFDDYRTTVGGNNGLKNKINKAWEDLKSNPNREANKRIVIIVSILILAFLCLIGFDLSIFFS